jgi:hydrogenase/urease accessory protein HupE
MKLRHLLNTTACWLSAAFATTSVAHEGHGDHHDLTDGLLHWLTEWDHLAALGVAIAIAATIVVRARRAKKSARSSTQKTTR